MAGAAHLRLLQRGSLPLLELELEPVGWLTQVHCVVFQLKPVGQALTAHVPPPVVVFTPLELEELLDEELVLHPSLRVQRHAQAELLHA